MKKYLVSKLTADLGIAGLVGETREVKAKSHIEAIKVSGIIHKGDKYFCYPLPSQSFQHQLYILKKEL